MSLFEHRESHISYGLQISNCGSSVVYALKQGLGRFQSRLRRWLLVEDAGSCDEDLKPCLVVLAKGRDFP